VSSVVGAALPPTAPPAAAVPTALVALAVTGWASVNVPLTSLPVFVALGSETVSVASPALEITFAVVEAGVVLADARRERAEARRRAERQGERGRARCRPPRPGSG
jgi:hypothetical protein